MFGKSDKKDKRFEVIHTEGSSPHFKILVDKETGVNYLFTSEGYSGGLTPLLDKEGNPVVTPIKNNTSY